ncbi:coiled-coil domain-containing protein 150 [Polymixia lowei]
MFCPAVPPLSVGATAPEASLSLLHQRLLVAEEQTEALIRDMGSLGVSREQLLEPVENRDPIQCPLSPVKMRQVLGGEAGGEGMLWRQCDSLVSRVCRIESLLQTLKLTTFRLETERELDPSHTAHLKEQLVALQQESEEEQRTARREVMKLRDQFHQACREREEARREVQKLGETLEVVTSTKMKEQMSQESAHSFEAMKSHSKLLQRVEEMERVVEMERRQAQLVQADCQAQHSEVLTSRQRLQEEEDKASRLQKYCQQLKQHTEVKDSLVSELKTELKKQQKENSKLLNEGGELRAAADKLQMLNNQLEGQCSQLSSALRSLTMENAKQQSEHQASLKAERSCVVKQLQEQDLLLEAARCNIHAELQAALSDKVNLQMELEKLKANHAQLLHSSTIAQETAVTQKELLERTIKSLRGELNTVKKEEEEVRKDQEGSKNELCMVVTKLEGERSALESQLSEAKREAGSLSSALQRQEEENRRLMRKIATMEQQQTSVDELQGELKCLKEVKAASLVQHKTNKLCKPEAWRGVSSPGGSVIGQTLENVLASHTRLQLNTQALQQELGGRGQELAMLKKDRLQAQRELQRHQAEVEKLQELLTSTHSKNHKALESLRKALHTTKVDSNRLARSLEQAVLTNSSLQSTITLRDEELREAWTKIGNLSKELHSLQHQRSKDESSRRAVHREISELRKSLEDSSIRSGDLSRANRELRQHVSELEKLVSNQRARIREQKSKLRQHLENRATLGNSQKVKDMEMELKHLEALKNKYQRKNNEQSQLIGQFWSESESLQRDLQRLSSSHEGALGAERELRYNLQDKCQITADLEEAHNWFKSKSDSQRGRCQSPEDPLDNRACSPGNIKDGAPTSSSHYTMALSNGQPERERWASTIQRWETKRELARIAGGYGPGQTQLLTQSH